MNTPAPCTDANRRDPEPLELSIVLPVYNEAGNIERLLDEIVSALTSFGRRYEIIAVNDGSTDASLEHLRRAMERHRGVAITVVNFSRNFGQTAALSCGFKQARGKLVIPLDADLQNDPADIPKLVTLLETEGYDLVSGWRRNRRDNPIRVIPSRVANALINKLIKSTGVRLHDYGCTLKVYRREVIQNIKLYGEMHRFIPAFAGWMGARVGECEINHRPRRNGVSKYGMGRIWKVVLDLIVVRFFTDSFTKPMQFVGKYIAYLAALMLLCLAGLFGLDLAMDLQELTLNTYIIVAAIFLLAIQNLVVIGLLGEILIRNYFETLDRDPYAIREIIPPGEARG